VSLAKQRGINIKESKSPKEDEFISLVQIELETDKEARCVSGTLSANKQPRIVKIDGYYVEVSLSGEMVTIKNWDRPGLIGNLGMLFSKHNINIAAMTFGREQPSGKAITILTVDSPISAQMLDKIKKLEHVLEARVIRI
jgi:D-3-phosphoglycerate dehydrogenase / 2-oxoglutarate reductase